MAIRLAVHVGPHKTGSTSVQRALGANRDRLEAAGVLYPPSLPDAEFPGQHADLAGLLAAGAVDRMHAWLAEAHATARARGCDTLLLSSENFRAPTIRRELVRMQRRYRRETGGDTRLLYVRRDQAALAKSQVIARLDGELGFFFRERYDLRGWAADFLHQQRQEERFFARHGGRFVDLATTPPAALTAELLRLATDRDFSFIETGRENVTSSRLAAPPAAMAAYGLRVMQKISGGNPIVGVTAQAAANQAEPEPGLPGYQELVAAFDAAVATAIAEGFADARRETVWHYRWRLLRRHLRELRRLW